jgi:MFS family permease
MGSAQSIDNPTRQVFVTEMVPPEDLQSAVGLSSANFQVARILGPAIAGVLIVLVGTGVCFLVNALSFLGVIAALLMLRVGDLYRNAPVARGKGQVREGLRYIWGEPLLRSNILMMTIVGMFALNSNVLVPLVARLTFHGTAATYSLLTVAMACGALVGALFAASRTKPDTRLQVIGGLVFGTALCICAPMPTLGLFAAVLAVLGLTQMAFLATSMTLMQMSCAPEMRGRVMSVYTMVIIGTTPFGGPLVGWISQAFSPRWAFLFCGVTALFATALFARPLLERGRVAHQRFELAPEATVAA